MRSGLAGIVALAAALAASAPSGARACAYSVTETDETVAAVKEAEQRLDDGDPSAARARAAKILEGAKSWAPEGLLDRLHRTLALAAARRAASARAPAARWRRA